MQARQRIPAVAFLGPVIAGADQNGAVRADTPASQRAQPRLHRRGQSLCSRQVESQLHRARDLVDVLSTRSGGADELELEILLRYCRRPVHGASKSAVGWLRTLLSGAAALYM